MSSSVEGVVNCAAYSEGCRIATIPVEAISDHLLEPNRFIWIGLHDPSGNILKQIQEEFQLHELAIEDALRAHQRPKLETYGETLFIVVRTVQMNYESRKLDFGETHFFVGKNFIVSIRHGSSRAYSEVRARCESTPQLLRKGPGFALYAVMDSIVDGYFPVIDELGQELEVLEERIFSEKPSREMTKQIYDLKRQLVEVKRAVSPLIDVCTRLMRFDLEVIPEDTRPYFRDVYDHVIRINEMVDSTREILATALEANFSLVSISQNEIQKRFAGWAAILAVPTMIAGIYGMNFKFMPELDWQYGYPVILSIIVIVCGLIYSAFKRAGWL
jgi:magnesium transporter